MISHLGSFIYDNLNVIKQIHLNYILKNNYSDKNFTYLRYDTSPNDEVILWWKENESGVEYWTKQPYISILNDINNLSIPTQHSCSIDYNKQRQIN